MFMWSASASESSIVIGPTSRRTRPRLSRRRVRCTGSSGRSDASRSASTWTSLFRAWRPPESLRPRPPALVLEPALARLLPWPGRDAAARHRRSRAELLHQTLDRELAIPALAPLVLRDGSDDGAGAGDDALLLDVRERRRRLDVERRLDPRRGLLGVLAAGSARARDPDHDLR